MNQAHKKVLMVGDDEWCTEWMEELLDECDIYGYKTNGIPTDKYDVEKLYANLTYTWPVQDLIDQINSGIHILNHVGHSYYDYNMRLTPENVSNLTNTKLSFIYSMGCMAGGFDDPEGYDSMAEWFTIKTESGAFAGIWNSREGWAGYLGSIAYDRQFWNAIFREDISAISKAIQHAKEDNIGFIQSDQEMRWCCYTLIYFGDPTIQLRHRPLLAFAEGPSDASLNTPVQFNGSVSGDRREPLRWRWDFGDGTISNDQNPLHVFETPGVYSIQLTLQDRTHQINSSTIVVTVHPPLVWVDDDFTNQTLGWGRDHFNTIQEGIDMVNASGTVLVSPGTYNTQLMINKPLTLRGDRCMSIINDTGEQSCTVTVTADRVTICGFTIQGKLLKTALSMGYSHWCLIQENTILDAYQGISFSFNDNNTISNNILQNSAWGIYLYRSSENNISNNTISSPSAQMNRGISIQDFCRQNKVSNNVISDSTQYGISLSNAENNTISHNTLTTNNDGILIGSNNNTIARNIIRENMRYGIFVFTNSRYNLISGNTIEDNNDSGIYMNSQSNLNTITDNVLGDNTAYGIYVKSSNNRIYNNIFENIHNAFATSSNNIWDLGPIIGGNSWSDWETNPGYPTTYIISQNNVDHYPVH